LIQIACTTSNCRSRLATKHVKIRPRSAPSSTAGSTGVTLRHLAVPPEGVARVRTADVRAERAAEAEGVALVAEVVDPVRIERDLVVRPLRRQHQRRPVAPAPENLRRDEILAPAHEWRRLAHVAREPRHVHEELAVDHVAAVPPQRLCRKLS
jgi:hypothetical protein